MSRPKGSKNKKTVGKVVPKKTYEKIMGRPPKYKIEFAQKLIDHFNKPTKEPVTDKEGNVLFDKNGNAVMKVCDFPTLASFACEIDVCRDTLHNWSTDKNPDNSLKHPEFFDAYKRSKDHQERILSQGGLSGAFQGNFAIFTAKNVIGWRDQQDLKHSGNAGITFNLDYGKKKDEI